MHVLFSGLTHCIERGPPWVCSSADRGERKQMLICRVLSMSWVYTQTWTDWDPPDNTNAGLWKKSHVINQKEKKGEKRWRWGKQKGFHIYLFKLPFTTSFPNINGILIKMFWWRNHQHMPAVWVFLLLTTLKQELRGESGEENKASQLAGLTAAVAEGLMHVGFI